MTMTTKTPVNSIKIPSRFVHACIGREGGMDCMLRAVTSTGNLTTGTIRPAGCNTPEEWYLQIWRELSCDLGRTVPLVDVHYDYSTAIMLALFEDWANDVIERLEAEYGLADWDVVS